MKKESGSSAISLSLQRPIPHGISKTSFAHMQPAFLYPNLLYYPKDTCYNYCSLQVITFYTSLSLSLFILLFEGLPKYRCKWEIDFAAVHIWERHHRCLLSSKFYSFSPKKNRLEPIKGAFVSACSAGDVLLMFRRKQVWPVYKK